MNIEAGSLVYSIAGRDKGKVFVVLSVDEIYSRLCDGKIRKCNKPKKKKLKHIKPVFKTCDALKTKILNGEKLTNAEIRKSIAAIMEDHVD